MRTGKTWTPKPYQKLEREVAEDVSGVSGRKIGAFLEQMFREANPDYEEEGGRAKGLHCNYKVH